MGTGGIILAGENLSTRRKTCHRFSLPTIDPTWTDQLSNSALRSEKSATKRLRKPKYLKKTCHSTTFTLQISRGLTCYRIGTSVVRILSYGTAVIWNRTSEGCTVSYSVVCLTTGPKPLPKRFLHIVRSKASSFK